jgi:hypothetical protein
MTLPNKGVAAAKETPQCAPRFIATSPPRVKLSILLAKIAPLALEASSVPLYKGLIQWRRLSTKSFEFHSWVPVSAKLCNSSENPPERLL